MNKALFAIIFFMFSMNGYSQVRDKDVQEVRAMINIHGIDAVMETLISYEQNQYPVKMNAMDTITSVFYLRGTNAKMYKHTLSQSWKEMASNLSKLPFQDIENYIPDYMQELAVASACSYKINLLYLSHGVRIVNVYSEISGKKAFTTIVTREDCKLN